jgi:hypothetical protein
VKRDTASVARFYAKENLLTAREKSSIIRQNGGAECERDGEATRMKSSWWEREGDINLRHSEK